MIRILWYIVIIAILATGAAWLADRPGDVAVVWQGYRIETSVAVAVLLVLAVVVVALLAWSVLRMILRTPDLLGSATTGRRRARGFTALSRGMIAVGSGDAAMARRYALEAGKLLGREPMTLLLRAQAAQLAGDRKTAEAAFNAMLEQPETRVLGLRGLYVEARRKGDLANAFIFAGKAAQLDPAVGWANEAMLEHLGAQRRWREALTMLERRLATGRMDRDLARRQRAVLLTADAMDSADADPDGALDAARQAAKLAPDLVPAVALHGRLLSRQGALRKAARVLEAGWKQSPHPEIAAAYIDMRPGDSALDRLDRARNLQRLTPGHAEARIIVARTAIDAREYDRARAMLEPLLKDRPPARVCLMMAEIAEHGPAGSGAVREWLARASRAPRDPGWIADGVVSDHWEPISPVSGRLDAFVWATPTELLGAHPAAWASEDVIADGDEATAVGYLQGAEAEADVTTRSAGKVIEATVAPQGEAAIGKSAPTAAPPPAAAVVKPPERRDGAEKSSAASPSPPATVGAEPRPKGDAAVTAGLASKAEARADEEAAARPRVVASRPQPSEVVFPMAYAPDDPGPVRDDDEAVQPISRRINL
ncbi:heme biosynthesis protein HemY [Camelimonas fluminis]|uniref:Heme biosynthesis protein HemY n=1 Tax=Camelimonas fluminis TaxID=1576911 RepID=A0ABV7UL33_9HYPH|nr:heme biosynthesis HemY N-terminal domain-containing protein [Camelimonas fluminis]GHE55695.1 heme biosynthesis protein HemY [Camelimonas fluminis]